jgi:hypothetical protein
MNSDLSLTLTACLIFLVLSSKVACNFFCKVAKLSDDMSAVARTVVFGLLLMGAMRIM